MEPAPQNGDADEAASICLGLSELPDGVVVELYRCAICPPKKTLFAVEAKLAAHLDAHAAEGRVERHAHCSRPCLTQAVGGGGVVACDQWYTVEQFSNEKGYGKPMWRCRRGGAADMSVEDFADPAAETEELRDADSAGPAASPSGVDDSDQDKNIDWPHQEVHADSLWNDELSQLEKEVVEEILHGGASAGANQGTGGVAMGFSLLGNGFQGGAGGEDLIGRDDVFGSPPSLSGERRRSGGGPLPDKSPDLPSIAALDSTPPARPPTYPSAASAASSPRQRPGAASWTRKSRTMESPSGELRTSSRTSQRQGAAFKCGIHKGLCACWKHEPDNYRTAEGERHAGGGHEYSKASRAKKKSVSVGQADVRDAASLPAKPLSGGKVRKASEASVAGKRPDDLEKSGHDPLGVATTSGHDDVGVRDEKGPDHCYAIVAPRNIIPRQGEDLQFLVGMDHNYCAVLEDSRSVEGGGDADGVNDSRTRTPDVEGALEIDEDVEEGRAESVVKKQKSKKRGRRKKERPDAESVDNAIDSVIRATMRNDDDDETKQRLKAKRKRFKKSRDKSKALLKRALLNREPVEGLDPISLEGKRDEEEELMSSSTKIEEESENAETSNAEDEEMETGKKEEEEGKAAASGAASAAADGQTESQPQTPAAASSLPKDDESPIGARRWSHLPKAAKRKRLKKFQAMLKAEKSKSGYLGLTAFSDSDEEIVRRVDSVKKRCVKKGGGEVGDRVNEREGEGEDFVSDENLIGERIKEEGERQSETSPNKIDKDVGDKIEFDDKKSSIDPSDADATKRPPGDSAAKTPPPPPQAKEKRKKVVLSKKTPNSVDTSQTQKMVANLTKMGLLHPGKTITVNEVKRANKRKGVDADKTISKKIRLLSGGTKPNQAQPDKAKLCRGVSLMNLSFVKEMIMAKRDPPPPNSLQKRPRVRCYFCGGEGPVETCSSAKEQLFNERLLAVCPRLAKESRGEFDAVCKGCLELLVKLEDTFYEMGDRRKDFGVEGAAMTGTESRDRETESIGSNDQIKETECLSVMEGLLAKMENGHEDRKPKLELAAASEAAVAAAPAVATGKATTYPESCSSENGSSSTFHASEAVDAVAAAVTADHKLEPRPQPDGPVAVKTEDDADSPRKISPRSSDEAIPLVFAGNNNNNSKPRAASPTSIAIKTGVTGVRRIHTLLANPASPQIVSGAPTKSSGKVMVIRADGSVTPSSAPERTAPRLVPTSSAARAGSVLEIHPVQVDRSRGHAHLYLSHKFIISYFVSNYLDHLVGFFCREKGVGDVGLAMDRIRRVLNRYQKLNLGLTSTLKVQMSAFMNCQVDLGALSPVAAKPDSTPIDPNVAVDERLDQAPLDGAASSELRRLRKEHRVMAKRLVILSRRRAEDMSRYQGEVVSVMRRCVKEAKDVGAARADLAAFAIRARSSFQALLALYRADVEILRVIADDALARNTNGDCEDPDCPHRETLEQVRFDAGETLRGLGAEEGPAAVLADGLRMEGEGVEEEEDEERIEQQQQRRLSEDPSPSSTIPSEDLVESRDSDEFADELHQPDQQHPLQQSQKQDEPQQQQVASKQEPVTDGLNLLCAAMEGDLRH